MAAYEEATRPREHAWSSFQTDPIVLGQYATVCERAGEGAKAQEIYERLLRSSNRPAFNAKGDWPAVDANVTSPKLVQGMALVLVGNAELLQDKTAPAIASYREAINRAPGSAITHFSLGYALKSKEATAREALQEFQEAKRLSAGDDVMAKTADKYAAEMHLMIDPPVSKASPVGVVVANSAKR